jgi:tryptophan synthase alpha chain
MGSGSATTSSDRDALGRTFAALRDARRCALIPYLTSGYPAARTTDLLLDSFAEAGADIIELGVPFSDPVADGRTIQRASLHALRAGTTLASTLERLAAFRARRDTPIVLFSYLNPILAYGPDRFIEHAAAAGASGVLVTDLPVGCDAELEATLEASPLALVRLVAPTTSAARTAEIAARAQGFLYYIARLGVTGAGATLRAELAAELAALRARAAVPVAVGFGIASPAHAAALATHADGIVIGSALIDALDRGGRAEATRLLAAMRAALDAPPRHD